MSERVGGAGICVIALCCYEACCSVCGEFDVFVGLCVVSLLIC